LPEKIRLGCGAKRSLTADITTALEDGVYGKVEFVRSRGFGNISAGPGLEGGDRILLLGILRENNDGQLAQTDLKPMEEIEPITAFEKQIQQNQIRLVFAHGGLRFRDGFGFAATFELFLPSDPIHEVLPKHGVILDHKDTPLGNVVSYR
jgi:hypothetical protein